MRIFYFHQYFKQASEAGPHRSFWLAKHLAEQGNEVVLFSGGKKWGEEVEICENFSVVYTGTPYDQQLNFWGRIWAFIGYVLSALVLSTARPKPDLLYCSSTPLTVAVIGLYYRFAFGIRYILELRDSWPWVPIDMGILKGKMAKIFSLILEKFSYQQSNGIVALSPPTMDRVKEMCPSVRCCLVSNFAEKWPETINHNKEHKVAVRPYILYAGALGRANGVEKLKALAKILKEHFPEFKLLVVGKGTEAHQLMGLESVVLKSEIPHTEMAGYYENAMACVVSFADFRALESVSPNKFFEAMAYKKPILLLHYGWLEEVLIEYGLGATIDLQDEKEAFKLISALLKNKTSRPNEEVIQRFSLAAQLPIWYSFLRSW